MSERIDKALQQFYGRSDVSDEHKEIFAAYTEIHDLAATLSGAPPLDEIGGAGVMEIAKVLTRFEGQIDDEWRAGLVRIGAGLLKQMWDNQKD